MSWKDFYTVRSPRKPEPKKTGPEGTATGPLNAERILEWLNTTIVFAGHVLESGHVELRDPDRQVVAKRLRELADKIESPTAGGR
jgi:hypothetical protein